MIEFLQSIKSDLLSRRLLPFVALLAVALIAARRLSPSARRLRSSTLDFGG